MIKKLDNKGFTLIEVIVVVAIIVSIIVTIGLIIYGLYVANHFIMKFW